MGLYRSFPGPLSPERFGDALTLADAATVLLLDGLGDGQDGDGAAAAGPVVDGQPPTSCCTAPRSTRRRACPPCSSTSRWLRRSAAYAYAHDRRLPDVARDIVARCLRLHGDRRLGGGP